MMKIKPFKTDIVTHAYYKETMLGLAKEDSRLSLVRRLQQSFGIRLDSIKFNSDTASGNFIHFTKYYGPALFGLSFGLEEASANLWDAQSGQQASELFGGMVKILNEIPLRSLHVNMARHFSTDGDLESYLESLNPHVPEGFKPQLSGRGAFYNLRVAEHDVRIFMTIVNSLLATKGLFVGIDYQFEPFTLDYGGLSEMLLKYNGFIMKELMLEEV